jgi:hypothetical protein
MKFIKGLDFNCVDAVETRFKAEPCSWRFEILKQDGKFKAVYYESKDDMEPLSLGEYDKLSEAMVYCEKHHEEKVLKLLDEDFVEFAEQFFS